MAAREWFYSDAGGDRKGPVSEDVLRGLLLRGSAVLSASTLVWRQGWEDWRPIVDTEDLGALAKAAFGTWYYGRGEAQEGPVSFAALRSLILSGEVEGQTLAWEQAACPEWTPLGSLRLFQDVRETAALAAPPDETAQAAAADVPEAPAAPEAGAADPGVAGPPDAPAASRPETAVAAGGARGRKKRKRGAWGGGGENRWIYVEGLPSSASLEAVCSHFKRCGVLDVDATTGGAKVRLYRDDEGRLKGDATICYARAESVALAIAILDGAAFSSDGVAAPLRVREAQFEKKEGAASRAWRPQTTTAQRLVAKRAVAQALSWVEDDDTGLGAKPMRIVVLKGLPTVAEEDVRAELLPRCAAFGAIEKSTLFRRRALVVVKFERAHGADACVRGMQGATWRGAPLSCVYWDGTTDYTKDADPGAAEDPDLDADPGSGRAADRDLPPGREPCPPPAAPAPAPAPAPASA